MRALAALFAGLVFGIGLTVSDMINPARVLGFLDLFGAWDPSAMFVFAGALPVFGLLFALSKRRAAPLFDSRFHPPEKTRIDAPLIVGAVLFGAGWGMVGFCPGPALAALSQPSGTIALFVAAMLAGVALHRLAEPKSPGSDG